MTHRSYQTAVLITRLADVAATPKAEFARRYLLGRAAEAAHQAGNAAHHLRDRTLSERDRAYWAAERSAGLANAKRHRKQAADAAKTTGDFVLGIRWRG